jgi:hypothetical protein
MAVAAVGHHGPRLSATGAAARAAKAQPSHGQVRTVSAGQRAAVLVHVVQRHGHTGHYNAVTAHARGKQPRMCSARILKLSPQPNHCT